MFAVFFGLLVAALQILSGAPSSIHDVDYDYTDLKSFNLHDHNAFRNFHRSRNSIFRKSPYLWPSDYRLHRFPIMKDFDYHVIPSRWVNDAGDSKKHVRTEIPQDNTISLIPGSDSTKFKQHTLAHQRTRSSIEERNVPFRKMNSNQIATGTNDLRFTVADKLKSVGQESEKDDFVVLPAEDVQATKDYGGIVSMTDMIGAFDDTQKKSGIPNTAGDTVKDKTSEVKESEDTDMDKGSVVIDVLNGTNEEISDISTIIQEKSGSPDINGKSEATTAKVTTSDNSDVDKVTTWHTTMDETSSKFPIAEETAGTNTSDLVTSNTVAEDKSSEITTTEKEKGETTSDLPSDDKSKKTSIENEQSSDTPSSPATEASHGTSEVPAKKETTFSSTVSKATSVIDEENTSPDTKISHSDDTLMTVSSSVPTTDIASSSSKVFSGSTAPSNVDSISISTEAQLKSSTAKSIAEETTAIHEHDIIIQSFRTARIVVTSVFLAIGLSAMAVLAVYIFKQKRKAVQYDQLTLLP